VLLTELKIQLNEVKRRLEEKIMADNDSYQAKEAIEIIDRFLLAVDAGDVPTKELLSKLASRLSDLSKQTQEKLGILDFVPLITKF
jgi:hypothetical protein